MTKRALIALLAPVACVALLAPVACDGDAGEPEETTSTDKGANTPEPAGMAPPEAEQEALEGGPYPTLLVTQAWFWKDANNKPKPGPARLELWRQTPDGWRATRLEDSDSNVFHKAIQIADGSIITIGAEGAHLKKWTFADGAWTGESLWHQTWEGKFNRLRDLEIGDVDGDGKDEYVIASHDYGVIAVYNPPEGDQPAEVIELDKKVDTFVHEIEIGDIDGDGKMEFFATPTGRNKANASQAGQMVMYRFDGTTYVRTVVDPFGDTHAKEILATDLDGDGTSELFSVVEAETDAQKNVIKPVEIRQYTLNEDGSFSHTAIATIDDRQTRFLIPGDFDGDGDTDLVAAAMKTGLWLLKKGDDGYEKVLIDAISSGFEHTSYAADLDGDGALELYVAADEQQELKAYRYNAEKNTFDKQLLGRIADNTITWNITTGSM